MQVNTEFTDNECDDAVIKNTFNEKRQRKMDLNLSEIAEDRTQ